MNARTTAGSRVPAAEPTEAVREEAATETMPQVCLARAHRRPEAAG